MCLCADIFFKTTDCLRADESTCYKPGDQHYQITHSGLDTQVCAKQGGASVRQAGRTSDSVYVLCTRFELQVQRYLNETTTFANLPDNLTWVGLGVLEGAGAGRKMCVHV